MSLQNKNNSFNKTMPATENTSNKSSGAILAERDLDSKDISFVDNYSNDYENLPSFKNQQSNTNAMHHSYNSKQLKRPTLKFRKPTFRRSPVDVLSEATNNIQKTANTIRLVANSVDGIVSSLEILGPVISSMSKDNSHSSTSKQNFMTTVDNEANYFRNPAPNPKKSGEARELKEVREARGPEEFQQFQESEESKKPGESTAPQKQVNFNQLLENPLVQNMLEDLKNKQK